MRVIVDEMAPLNANEPEKAFKTIQDYMVYLTERIEIGFKRGENREADLQRQIDELRSLVSEE